MDKINDRLGEFVITPVLMMGMGDIILDRISFGSIKELEEIYFDQDLYDGKLPGCLMFVLAELNSRYQRLHLSSSPSSFGHEWWQITDRAPQRRIGRLDRFVVAPPPETQKGIQRDDFVRT